MATTLSHSDIHARNTFDNREAVIPQKKESLVRNGVVVHTFPAASVTALSIHLT
jgi:alpha-L-arabinofuranosidase